MSVTLFDTFDNEHGLSGYDAPVEYGTTGINAILANQHVNLRVFDNTALSRPRTQADLDGLTQTFLDTQTQAQLESVQTNPGEGWANPSNTGITSYTVGAVSALNNWRALVATVSGAYDSTWVSSMGASGSVDIGGMDYVSLVAKNSAAGTFDLTNCTIQLDISPAGDFSVAADVSAIVPFTAGTNNELRVTRASLASGAGATYAAADTAGSVPVTGVKIRFKSLAAPTNGDTVTIAAIRAYKTGYDPSWGVDTSTRYNAVVVPVTFDLNAPANASPPLVRGTTTQDSGDPRPQDSTTRIALNLGALAGASYNTADLIFREQRSGTAGSFIRFRFQFRGADAKIQADLVSWDGASETVTNGIASTAIPGATWTALKSAGYVMLECGLVGNQVTITLRNTDSTSAYGSAVFAQSSRVTLFSSSRGRVGWGISFNDRDILLQDFNAFASSFATLISKPYTSLTPVAGAQLVASFAEDTNLFDTFFATYGVTLTRDTQTTLSGNASYKSTGPIVSNTFRLDDVGHTYIELDLWVPDQVDPSNQPAIVLRSQEILGGGGPSKVTFPPLQLQGNQWNHIYVELVTSSGIIPGLNYQLFLESGNSYGTSYEWNVDNVMVGRRNVAWSAKSLESSANWYEFRDLVNDQLGALHFSHDERGKSLRIMAVAISEEAWISSYMLTPIYAQLGRPIYHP